MKSAISIELDGTPFTCDEGAYAALRSYLDRAGERLGAHPDRAEVIAGLERSIAEKLRARVQAAAAIDEAVMLAALKAVGRVDGPALHDSASSEGSRYGERRTRKLYRLREGHWIAGVCTGLAAYVGLDVVVIRLFFILVGFFTDGITILMYLILAFVMPIALTDSEVTDARGGARSGGRD